MKIENCTIEDIPVMNALYEQAIAYQKERSLRHWGTFEYALLEKEISEKRQWKIMEGNEIACIFMICYDDPDIWGERNKDPSVYIHRIVTHPSFRGRQYTHHIIEWAKLHARQFGKSFLRMDTWGDNKKLNDYYMGFGFELLEIRSAESTANLPKHYNCISLSLLEMKLI